jgi:hypothetical protein
MNDPETVQWVIDIAKRSAMSFEEVARALGLVRAERERDIARIEVSDMHEIVDGLEFKILQLEAMLARANKERDEAVQKLEDFKRLLRQWTESKPGTEQLRS